MEKIYENIINEGKKNGKSIEEINDALEAAGANFFIDPDVHTAGWSDKEMAEGFIPAEKEPEALPQTLNTRRREDLAGTVQIQRIVGATYEVTYDEDGYFLKASRVRHG